MKKHYFLILCCIIQLIAADQLIETHSEDFLVYNGFKEFLGDIHSYKMEQPLGGGLSNTPPILYSVNGIKYVVRIFKGLLSVRKNHIRANLLVASEHIAPHIYYYVHYDDFSFIIMNFIDSRTLPFEQENNYVIFNCIAQKLKALAQFDPIETNYKENFFEENMRHYRNIKKKNFKDFDPILEEIKNRSEDIHQKIAYYNRSLVMGHNDFYPRNIFFIHDDIIVIDWDTMGLNYEFGDLASYSIFFCLNQAEDFYLLKQYLQYIPTAEDEDYFKNVKLMVRLCLALNFFAMVEEISESLITEPIKGFKYYAIIFAENSDADSSEFFYKCGMSQLQEFRQEYEPFDKLPPLLKLRKTGRASGEK